MQCFTVWNDTWQWKHSSYLLKMNVSESHTFFIKSCHDVSQTPHMAPRTLHTTLQRCCHITWQHYRRMWSGAKTNICGLISSEVIYSLKPTALTVTPLTPAYCSRVLMLRILTSCWLQMALRGRWHLKWLTTNLCWQVLYTCPPALTDCRKVVQNVLPYITTLDGLPNVGCKGCWYSL